MTDDEVAADLGISGIVLGTGVEKFFDVAYGGFTGSGPKDQE